MKAYHLMGSAPYYTNCYLLTDNQGNAVLFDCSIRWDKIDAILKNDGVQLKEIFMTHGHHDHRECLEDVRKNVCKGLIEFTVISTFFNFTSEFVDNLK